MKWKESQNPFLHQFIDLLFQFQNNRQSDLSKFIDYYEANKAKFALKMPDSKNAVQIMTIHKAKGLEFPIVIIPEMDFSLGLRSDSKFFIESEDKVLYTHLSKSSINEDVAVKANQEKNLILLDKLNMLYVAFTRAENRLYVFNRYTGKSNMGALFHDCIEQCFSLVEDGGFRYVSGKEVAKYKSPIIKEQDDSFYTASDVAVGSSNVELILSDEVSESHLSQPERLFGIYFHQFMAQVNQADQIPNEIKRYEENDLIDSTMLSRISESALVFFQRVDDSGLFKDALAFHNEKSILIPESQIIRPDKIIERTKDVVVIDFKTGSAKNTHHEQIWNYKAVLEEIYEKPVKSLLYYTQQNQFIEI
jgi:ATP-dependent exoDNAse (exonuclease V) beta subunit